VCAPFDTIGPSLTRQTARQHSERTAPGTFTCLPRVKICVNNPSPAAPNPAPPAPYSSVRLFFPAPRPLWISTSELSTRYSFPPMSTENRSHASSGLCTAPPLLIFRTRSFARRPGGNRCSSGAVVEHLRSPLPRRAGRSRNFPSQYIGLQPLRNCFRLFPHPGFALCAASDESLLLY
jgi:hypothetical protein